jgi:lipid II:glycine glycyltransferase (peptidoglycan interpeptide bridge formation enzyme)
MVNILDKENELQGLNYFKLNFGCKCYEYFGDFELVTNNALYFMYRNSMPLRSILKK